MRRSRCFIKPVENGYGVYFHITNHTVNLGKNNLPISEKCRAKFLSIAEHFLHKYNLEMISMVVLGNHFHMLVYNNPNKFDLPTAFKALHKFRKINKQIDENHFKVRELSKHSNNISEYLREVQRTFTVWFNKNCGYPRKGALWRTRFNAQQIESAEYLWNTIKYIEMNAVRAGIVKKAEDYPYSSLGRWKNSHPYQASFLKHLNKIAKEGVTIEEIKQTLKCEIAIQIKKDNAQKLQQKGLITAAQEELDKAKVLREGACTDIILSSLEISWDNKAKMIGSEDWIKKRDMEWSIWRRSG